MIIKPSVKEFKRIEVPEASVLAAVVSEEEGERVLIFGSLAQEYPLDGLVGGSIYTAQGRLYESLEPLATERLSHVYDRLSEYYPSLRISHLTLGRHIIDTRNGDRFIPEYTLQ